MNSDAYLRKLREEINRYLEGPAIYKPAELERMRLVGDFFKHLSRNENWKYNEPRLVVDLLDYIANTYGQHYVDPKTNVQVIDLYISLGMAPVWCQGAAIKYLARFGKKAGRNRLDLLKALHYTILLQHCESLKENE